MERNGTPATSSVGISSSLPSSVASSVATTPYVPDIPAAVPEPIPAPPPPDPAVAALSELASIRASDAPRLTLSGQWVAQLASKLPGIVDPLQTTAGGSHTFTATDILNEHTQARDNADFGNDVRLLQSTDYGRGHLYKGHPLWVTVAIVPSFASEQDVTAWCAQQFPNLSGKLLDNACTARKLNPPADPGAR
jgi:hypothetical protein